MTTPLPTLTITTRVLLYTLRDSCLPRRSTTNFRPNQIPTRPLPRRQLNKYAKLAASKVTPFNDPNHPLDESIQSTHVRLVSGASLQDPTPLKTLLKKIDRNTEHVQQVDQYSDGLPIVRIHTKAALRQDRELKLAQQKAQQSAQRSGKELEFGWGIEPNDLEHRLRKMEGFLAEGRNVEVMIAHKKKGAKVASEEEMKGLVERVKASARSVPGVNEGEMVGKLGKQVMILFRSSGEATSGKSVSTQVQTAEKVEKMKKKEEEKERRRQEAEQKRLRAETRERERLERLKGGAAKG